MPRRPCALGTSQRSKGLIRSLAFSAEGKLLAAAGDDGRIRLWDVSDPASIDRLGQQPPQQNGAIQDIAFSPVSPLIATAGEDGKVRVWNVADPRHPALVGNPLSIHDGQPVNSVAFSPSGALLASAGTDQQVALSAVSWDPATRQAAVSKIPGTLFQTNTIDALAFSPDGATLAAGDGDGSVCLYDVATRRTIGSDSCLLGHYTANVSYGGMTGVQFTRDGKALLTAGTGDPIIAWSSLLWSRDYGDQASTALRSRVCAIAARNLTGHEWGEIFSGTDVAADRHATCPRYPLP
jgi:WD40 repeat protein